MMSIACQQERHSCMYYSRNCMPICGALSLTGMTRPLRLFLLHETKHVTRHRYEPCA